MDPDEALRLLRKAIEELDNDLAARDGAGEMDIDGSLDDQRSAVEHFRALDEWLSRGGFLPADWAQSRSV